MKRCLLVLLAMGLVASVPLSAQIKITGLEGLAAKAKSNVEVEIGPDMIKLVEGFLPRDSPDSAKAKELIGGLKSIIVRSFEFAQEGQYKIEDLTTIREQLRAPGWSKLVGVTEPGELTEVYAKTEQGKMAGLVVITAEAKELTVVSIEGTLDLAALSQLGGQLGIPNIPILGQLKPNPQPKGKGK